LKRPNADCCGGDVAVYLLRGTDADRIVRPLAQGNAADVGIVSGLPAADDSGNGNLALVERAVRCGDTVSSGGVRLRKPEVLLCPCGHEPAQHDQVALRYCAATNAHSGSPRGCICAAALSQAAVRR
jgi:hypothetical protein